jgi:hypothetical protein
MSFWIMFTYMKQLEIWTMKNEQCNVLSNEQHLLFQNWCNIQLKMQNIQYLSWKHVYLLIKIQMFNKLEVRQHIFSRVIIHQILCLSHFVQPLLGCKIPVVPTFFTRQDRGHVFFGLQPHHGRGYQNMDMVVLVSLWLRLLAGIDSRNI